MGLIDLILNIAAILLWLKWLERDVSTVVAEPRISVVTNLRRATPKPSRVMFLGALLLLILVRSLVYWLLGSALDWIPKLHIGLIPLSFRSHMVGRTILYSFLSFGEALGIFYLSLLLFSVINRRMESDPVQKLIRSYLGWVDSLPLLIKLFLPWVGGLIVWCSLNPLFKQMGLVVPPRSFMDLVKEGAFIGLGVYLLWKYVLVAALVLYVLHSYIYFGDWPLWTFIENTGKHILKTLAWVPLRFWRIDFAPLVAVTIILVVGDFADRQLVAYWTNGKGKVVPTIEHLRR